MDADAVKIGLAADLFDTRGRPLFDPGVFDLFREAGLPWTVLPPDGGMVDPDAVASFDVLLINGSRLTEASLALDSGRLRVVARNGVGFDAVDVQALTRRGILGSIRISGVASPGPLPRAVSRDRIAASTTPPPRS